MRRGGEGVRVSYELRFESCAVATNEGSQLSSVSKQKETVDIRMAVSDSWAYMKEPAAGSSKCTHERIEVAGRGSAGGVGGGGGRCNSGQHAGG